MPHVNASEIVSVDRETLLQVIEILKGREKYLANQLIIAPEDGPLQEQYMRIQQRLMYFMGLLRYKLTGSTVRTP
jgi:hypothetical protein